MSRPTAEAIRLVQISEHKSITGLCCAKAIDGSCRKEVERDLRYETQTKIDFTCNWLLSSALLMLFKLSVFESARFRLTDFCCVLMNLEDSRRSSTGKYGNESFVESVVKGFSDCWHKNSLDATFSFMGINFIEWSAQRCSRLQPNESRARRQSNAERLQAPLSRLSHPSSSSFKMWLKDVCRDHACRRIGR